MRGYQRWLSVGLLALTPGVAAAGLINNGSKSSAPNSSATAAAAADRAAKKKKEINQDLAVRVGKAVQKIKLNGYDIQIDVADGVVTLDGTVGSRDQRMAVAKAAGAVTGVTGVNNRLRIGEPASARSAAQEPASVIRGQNPSAPAAMPAYGPPDAMGGSAIYNQPNLPNNSWPTYAQYPNYSAVTYPSQYSASAWPYIGPFYPYPQVPLGWRKATLEWNEGNWNLSFGTKTNRWWWFMNPNCW
jgi:hypothetical protein